MNIFSLQVGIQVSPGLHPSKRTRSPLDRLRWRNLVKIAWITGAENDHEVDMKLPEKSTSG
jgi:hypothetical protein